MIRWLAILALAAAALMPAPAAAQRCGDTLHGDTRLQQDIVCTKNEPFALKLAAPGMTLDMNGRAIVMQAPCSTLSTFPTAVGPAILVEKADDVMIMNGRIQVGCNHSVPAMVSVRNSDRARIAGMEFVADISTAVDLYGSRESLVEGNVFRTASGVRIHGAPSRPSAAVRIMWNVMPLGRASQSSFVWLSDSHDVEVAYNDVERAAHLVWASGAARLSVVANVVRDGYSFWNSIVNPSIWVDGIDGYIASNRVAGSAIGLRLQGQGHLVEANEFEAYLAVIDVCGVPTASGNIVSGNRLTTTSGTGVGIRLCATTQANDARGNTFVNVANTVIDLGVGNLH